MLVVLPFFAGDRAQAYQLSDWINELGPYPNHELLVVRKGATPIPDMGKSFGKVSELQVHAGIEGWPQGPNATFSAAAKHIEFTMPQRWLWLEPDAIPLRAGWLDEIAAEYEAARKPFMGDFVHRDMAGFIDHMSGVAVYPGKITALAGEALIAHDTAWDCAAAGQILPKMHRSKLIQHLVEHENIDEKWRHQTFLDMEQVRAQIRPDVVLFHASKDGSLCRLLKQQEAERFHRLPNGANDGPCSMIMRNETRIIRDNLSGGASRTPVKTPSGSEDRRQTNDRTSVDDLTTPTQTLFPIYTYCEDIGGNFADPELLEMSRASFARHGFAMVVLREKDAETHPLYWKFSCCPTLYDNRNITPYLKACYMRWLAVSERSKKDDNPAPVMVDFDVINYGFTPRDLPGATATMLFFNVMAVPGMMIGTPSAYDRIITAFSQFADTPRPTAKGHIHDQNIVELHPELWTTQKLMVEYPSAGWESAKLVHYPHARLYFPGQRSAKIKELRDPVKEPKPDIRYVESATAPQLAVGQGWIKLGPKGEPLGTFMWDGKEWIPSTVENVNRILNSSAATARLTELTMTFDTVSNPEPWKSSLESIEEIKHLATRLKSFCTAPVYIRRVRDELAAAGVTKTIVVKRRRKRKRK